MGRGQGSNRGNGNGATKCTARPLSVVIQAAERALKKADKVTIKCAEAVEYDLDAALQIAAPVENKLFIAGNGTHTTSVRGGAAQDAGPVDEEDDVPLAKRARRRESDQQHIGSLENAQRNVATIDTNTNTKESSKAVVEPEVVDLLSESDTEAEAAPPPPPPPLEAPLEEAPQQVQKDGDNEEEDIAAAVPQVEEIELGSTSEEEEEAEKTALAARSREADKEALNSTQHRTMVPPPNKIAAPRTYVTEATLRTAAAAAAASIAETTAKPAAASPRQQKRKSEAASLDEPYEFTSHETAKEFQKGFKKTRAKPGMGPSAIQKRAKELLSEMTTRSPATVKKTQNAWHSAAMAWRQKYMPSEEEVKRRQQEDSARMAELSRQRTLRTPAQRAQVGGPTAGMGGQPLPQQPGPTLRQLEPPSDDADEADWRSYYRNTNQCKVESATSFVQVLRIFKVSITDPGKVKDAYRLAVRMYHPDSNSKERMWKGTELYQKIEAEEIMKIINEKKPDDL